MKDLKLRVEKEIKEKISFSKKLDGGNHHDTYLIETTSNKYILKFGNEEKLVQEYKFLKKISRGIAPSSIYISKTKPLFFIQEYIEGIHPKKVDSEFIKKMAKTYKKLHSNKTSKIPNEEKKLIYSLLKWFERYEVKILELNKSKKLETKIEVILQKLRPIIKKYDKSFSNRKEFSLCHNDADLSNIFIVGEEIKFIDWEFSGYWLEERDLINFIKSNDLDKARQELFLKEYGYLFSKKFNALFIMFLLSDIKYLLSQKRVRYVKIESIIEKITKLMRELK